MTTHDTIKPKLSLPLTSTTIINPSIPGFIPSADSSQNLDPERLYVFPAPNDAVTTQTQATTPRGHSRSVSHGGGQVSAPSRPLKSAMRGHQRALSHGQISEVSTPPHRSGHSRVGSKTDFILPPGHKDTLNVGDHHIVSNPSSARGHSRQASRSESIYTLRHTEIVPWWKRVLFCRSNKFEDRGYRIVVPNHIVPINTPQREHPNGARVGNKIRTTKYTLLSFLPKNLLEQFHRIANLYFIFIVLLNWVPAINAFGKEIAMIPVLFVLGVTAIKDLFEDRRRRQSDKRINNTTCRIYNGQLDRYKKVIWQDIRVGDLIHLSNNETVPADILLLRTSDPFGVCYIDTCDLDGETNLKRREVVRGFLEKQSTFSPNQFISRVEVDAPTTKIYRFHGVIHPTGERVPLTTDNLLLRESRLKNTDFVEGLVVYAGHETKSMLNNSGPRYKRSKLEQQMNIDVIWCVIILIILCLIGAFGYKSWLTSYVGISVPFLSSEITPTLAGVLNFWTFVITLQVMIPLSLYVTIELSKILQVYHIHNNTELYDSIANKKTECRAMNITEELGQVQYVFSDKTGTLTENKMIFRRCTIAGTDYNHPPSELEAQHLKPGAPAPPIVINPKLKEDLEGWVSKAGKFTGQAEKIHEFFLVLAICNTVVVSQSPHRDIMNASGVIEGNDDVDMNSLDSSTTNENYLRLNESRSVTPSPTPPNTLAIKQHSVHIPSLSPISSSAETSPTSTSPELRYKNLRIPTKRAKAMISSKLTQISTLMNNKVTNKSKIAKHNLKHIPPHVLNLSNSTTYRPIFEAESPDELALVNAAFSYGSCLINRAPTHVLVNHMSSGVKEFEILKVLPFDSNRKCMSVIVRCVGTNEIVLYCKGADSSIMSMLSYDVTGEDISTRESIQHQLNSYARQGLRVLVMAKRVLTDSEYLEWTKKHQECEVAMENREKKIRDSFMVIESNLVLLGATGIEDRLQEGVPETIYALIAAGIVVWVVTGDKPETAINVAYSAKLFDSDMELLKLTGRSRDAAENSIIFYLNEIEKQQENRINMSDLSNHHNIRSSVGKKRALVVDGKTLTFILDLRSNLTKPFLKLTQHCVSVLCCRSTPLQKAFLVKIVKEELQMRTLAIGDGANDVSMIQMADVGIGISGQEGMQAVMASDFTLARFHMLQRLLLVHGHWCYDRLSRMILYFFYKNAAFVFLIFWYQLYCGFSGAVMIDEMYLMLFNFVFTSLPPLAIGVYDKNVPEDLLLSRPYLYRHSRLGHSYRSYTFWIVMLDSMYQSLVMFFVAEAAYWDSDVGIWEFGATIATACLITMLADCAIDIQSWTILHVLSIAVSLGSFYVFSFLYNAYCVTCLGLPSTYWVIYVCMGTVTYWLVIILTVVLALLPRFVLRVLQTSVWPSECTQSIINQRQKSIREPSIRGLRIRF